MLPHGVNCPFMHVKMFHFQQLPQQRVMPAATFESVYQSANLKRSSPVSSQEIQPDGSPAKKLRVDIDDVKELVQV